MLTNCIQMLVLGTNRSTGHSMGCKQTCPCSHVMDSGLRQTLGKIEFIQSSHKCLPTNIVMWSTQHSTVNWVCSKTHIVLATLRTQKSTSGVEFYVFFFFCKSNIPICWVGKKHTSVSHSSTESDTISLDAGLRLDGHPALDLWCVVLRSTNNTRKPTRLASGDWQRTENHSHSNKISHPTRLVAGSRNEQCTRNVDQLSNVTMCPATHTHFSR